MAYNFKNLADVELLEAMPEEANVLVEVNGTTKRAPQAASGGNGGDSGGVKAFSIVHNYNTGAITASMPYEEIKNAIENGEFVTACVISITSSQTRCDQVNAIVVSSDNIQVESGLYYNIRNDGSITYTD